MIGCICVRGVGCGGAAGFGDFGGGFCFVTVLLVVCLGCCVWCLVWRLFVSLVLASGFVGYIV